MTNHALLVPGGALSVTMLAPAVTERRSALSVTERSMTVIAVMTATESAAFNTLRY